MTFSGWLKTENVTGYAELWFRIDDKNGKLLSLTNYPRATLKGTTGWTEYTRTVDLPEDADHFYLGFLIVGNGKVWGDDFRLTVDGVPVEKVKQGNKLIFPA